MRLRKIVSIVEGYGEEKAVPCLIRRWLKHRRLHYFFDVHNDLAINTKGCGKLKAAYNRARHLGIEHYVEAAMRYKPDAIIVILDADEECLIRGAGVGLGPELLDRAKAVIGRIPLSVVVANREYEAWFLASITSIRAAGLFPNRVNVPGKLEPERPRDCKGFVAELMGCKYEETVHQLILTHKLSFSSRTKHRSPSYGKLLRDLEKITCEARRN